jgi:hypothetical protein
MIRYGVGLSLAGCVIIITVVSLLGPKLFCPTRGNICVPAARRRVQIPKRPSRAFEAQGAAAPGGPCRRRPSSGPPRGLARCPPRPSSGRPDGGASSALLAGPLRVRVNTRTRREGAGGECDPS